METLTEKQKERVIQGFLNTQKVTREERLKTYGKISILNDLEDTSLIYQVTFSDRAEKDGDFIKVVYKGVEQLCSSIMTVDSDKFLSIEELMGLYQGTKGIESVSGTFKI